MNLQCPTPEQLERWVRQSLTPAAFAKQVSVHVLGCPVCTVAAARKVGQAGPALGQDATQAGVTPNTVRKKLERGAQIGRYVVVDELGEGGVGVVYACFDPELDRKIAVKLLQSADAASQELLIEAQAMAKLSHPNVLAVHDVGRAGDQGVFMAMELVDGLNLRGYLKMHPSLSWREKLQLLLDAGEGLNAAHLSGLIHRDFKPDNVLVDAARRVRVMDFGLARMARSSEPEALPLRVDAETTSASLLLFSPKTQAGVVKGTPAYVAPEQLLNQPATAQADQFAFAVSLYEALYGRRPFDGSPLRRPTESRWQLREPPKGADVPAWLQRVLSKGLSERPEDRYPSLAELLVALRADPTVRRKRQLAAAAVLVVAALSVVAGNFFVEQHSQVCRGAQTSLAGVWDGPTDAHLRDVFSRHPSEASAAAWERTRAGLNRFTRGWATMRTEACEATRLRKEQSEDILTLRMGCLDKRLYELRSTLGILDTANEAVLLKAPEMVNAFTPLAGCADILALKSEVPLPDNPDDRLLWGAGQKRLLDAKALFAAGKEEDALKISRAVLAQARSRKVSALEAQALYQEALVIRDQGGAETNALLWQALLANLATHQDPTAVDALVNLAMSHVNERQATDAEHVLQLAQAVQARIPPNPLASALLTCAQASVTVLEGDCERSSEVARRCSELAAHLPANNELFVARLYSYSSRGFNCGGHGRESVLEAQKSLAARRAVTGDLNPLTAISYSNLAVSQIFNGEWTNAVDNNERALGLLQRMPQADPVLTLVTRVNLGESYFGQGRFDSAESTYLSALAMSEALTRAPAVRAMTLVDLGLLRLRRDGPGAAAPLYAEALSFSRVKLDKGDASTRRAMVGVAWTSGLFRPAERSRRWEELRTLEAEFQKLPTETADQDLGLVSLALSQVGELLPARRHEARAHAVRAKALFAAAHQPILEAWANAPPARTRPPAQMRSRPASETLAPRSPAAGAGIRPLP